MPRVILILLVIVLTFFALTSEKVETNSDITCTTIELLNSPNAQGVPFMFTVDDITLTNDFEKTTTNKIVSLLKKNNISATFFAIPQNMKEYDFPDNIEIAQHGYTHINPYTGKYSEYKGLTNEKLASRLNFGKTLLEEKGYKIYGHRAPTLALSEDQRKVIKDMFDYDSSYMQTVGDDFHIPLLWLDVNYYMCRYSTCSKSLLNLRKSILVSYFNSYESNKKPLVLISHFWSFAAAFDNPNTSPYFDSLFDEVHKRNFWITTMQEYNDWNNNVKSINYSLEETDSEVIIEFNNCLQNLSFTVSTDKTIFSNCDMFCENRLCIIKGRT